MIVSQRVSVTSTAARNKRVPARVFNRDRRIVTIAVCSLFIALAVFSYHQLNLAAEDPQPNQSYQPVRDSTFPSRRVAGEPTADRYDPHCELPQEQADADLCAQWAAVAAVEESNRLARLNLRMTALGFGLSVLGGLLAALGTWFVWRSLKQAEASLQEARAANIISKTTFDAENRAWLVIDKLDIDKVIISSDKETGQAIMTPAGTAYVKNVGRFPARFVYVMWKIVRADVLSAELDSNQTEGFSGRFLDIVIPGDPKPVPIHSTEPLYDVTVERGIINLILRVHYQLLGSNEVHNTFQHWVLGKPHSGSATWQFSPGDFSIDSELIVQARSVQTVQLD